MKIYTKKGDAGETSLYGGKRVSKDDLRIQSYGTYDELNAAVGVVISQVTGQAGFQELSQRLLRIQGELFQLGAELATPEGRPVTTQLLGDMHIAAMEREIDAMEAELAPLRTFILPGGGLASAQLHFARTVSRRAERELVTLQRLLPLRAEVLGYANRLSDYLFVCARYANHLAGASDVPWVAPHE